MDENLLGHDWIVGNERESNQHKTGEIVEACVFKLLIDWLVVCNCISMQIQRYGIELHIDSKKWILSDFSSILLGLQSYTK